MHFPHGKGLSLEAFQNTVGFIPCFLAAKATLGYQISELFADDFKAEFFKHDYFQELLKNTDQSYIKSWDQVHQSLYFWTKLSLANYILRTLGDGVEMGHSIEGRLPFLDHQLFEIAAKLPVEMKIHNGISKYILRKALKDHLPKAVLERKKQPFFTPPCQIEHLVDQIDFKKIPFFDEKKCRAFFEMYKKAEPELQIAKNPVLYFLATTYAFHNRFHL